MNTVAIQYGELNFCRATTPTTTHQLRQTCWGAAKGRAWCPPWWARAAPSPGVYEYSDETDYSELAQDFYTLSWAPGRLEAPTVIWLLKVHPTLLCGGTKAKGLYPKLAWITHSKCANNIGFLHFDFLLKKWSLNLLLLYIYLLIPSKLYN